MQTRPLSPDEAAAFLSKPVPMALHGAPSMQRNHASGPVQSIAWGRTVVTINYRLPLLAPTVIVTSTGSEYVNGSVGVPSKAVLNSLAGASVRVTHFRSRTAALACLKEDAKSYFSPVLTTLIGGASFTDGHTYSDVSYWGIAGPDTEYDPTKPVHVIGTDPMPKEESELLSLLQGGTPTRPTASPDEEPPDASRGVEINDGKTPPHMVSVLKGIRKPSDYIASLRAGV